MRSVYFLTESTVGRKVIGYQFFDLGSEKLKILNYPGLELEQIWVTGSLMQVKIELGLVHQTSLLPVINGDNEFTNQTINLAGQVGCPVYRFEHKPSRIKCVDIFGPPKDEIVVLPILFEGSSILRVGSRVAELRSFWIDFDLNSRRFSKQCRLNLYWAHLRVRRSVRKPIYRTVVLTQEEMVEYETMEDPLGVLKGGLKCSDPDLDYDKDWMDLVFQNQAGLTVEHFEVNRPVENGE